MRTRKVAEEGQKKRKERQGLAVDEEGTTCKAGPSQQLFVNILLGKWLEMCSLNKIYMYLQKLPKSDPPADFVT